MKRLLISAITGVLLLVPFVSVAQSDKDFTTVVEKISPEMGYLLRDINQVRKKACGDVFSDPELRHIVAADNNYYMLLEALMKNPHVRGTEKYRNKIEAAWSDCRVSNRQEDDKND